MMPSMKPFTYQATGGIQMLSTATTIRSVSLNPQAVAQAFEEIDFDGCTPDADLFNSFINSSYIPNDQDMIQTYPENFVPRPQTNSSFANYHRGGVFLFKNVFMATDQPVVFDCRTVLSPLTCFGKTPKDSIKIGSFKKVVTIDAGVMIHQKQGNHGYYHAHGESLPRIGYFLDYLKANPDVGILGSPRFIYRNRFAWNRLLNLTNPWHNYVGTLFVKKLLLPTGSHCGNIDPIAANLLYEGMKPQLGELSWESIKNKSDEEKMLIVLQRREKRKIINHDELLNEIQSKFADCCYVEEFYGNETLVETAVLHHRADIIVGPHGAGLVNAIFARRPPETVVGQVEFHQTYGNQKGRRTKPPRMCHQSTAEAIGMLSAIVVQTDGSKFDDFHVNTTSAILAVEKMISDVQQARQDLPTKL
jgi:hypothetical protein